jgi:hypothetical protein
MSYNGNVPPPLDPEPDPSKSAITVIKTPPLSDPSKSALTVVKTDTSSQSPPVDYEMYRKKAVDLLNLLIKPCLKDSIPPPPPPPESKDKDKDIDKDKDTPEKSSTFLKHNGEVGDLEDLIVFLIKAPTTETIKIQLNQVYKIFNPNARDIITVKKNKTES